MTISLYPVSRFNIFSCIISFFVLLPRLFPNQQLHFRTLIFLQFHLILCLLSLKSLNCLSFSAFLTLKLITCFAVWAAILPKSNVGSGWSISSPIFFHCLKPLHFLNLFQCYYFLVSQLLLVFKYLNITIISINVNLYFVFITKFWLSCFCDSCFHGINNNSLSIDFSVLQPLQFLIILIYLLFCLTYYFIQKWAKPTLISIMLLVL